jgi:hypothetical protein
VTDEQRLQLLEHALLHRDWMSVMDVVEDMGGNWKIYAEHRATMNDTVESIPEQRS